MRGVSVFRRFGKIETQPPKSVQSENISVNLAKTNSSLSVHWRHVDVASSGCRSQGSVKSPGSRDTWHPSPQAALLSPWFRTLAVFLWRLPFSSPGGVASPLPRPPSLASLPPPPSLHLLPKEVTDGPVIWFHSLDWSNTCPPPLGCKGLIPNRTGSQRRIRAHMQMQ